MDLQKIILHDLDWHYAGEIVIRTFIMFSVILAFLRLTGKKGVRQLSIFEVAIIIGLGSAAGDPMSNPDNAIVPAIIVFVTILGFYRLLTWFAARSEKFESVLEGDPMYIIEDGRFVLMERNAHTFAKDEFFAEMRQQGIEHVGQVRIAILETSGTVSFFFFEDSDVKPGLPVLPKEYEKRTKQISKSGEYACTFCGEVEQIEAGSKSCSRCEKDEWVKTMDTLRIT